MVSKRLTIDVGNTAITCAVWQNNKLQKKFFYPTKDFSKFKFKDNSITQIVYASVVPSVDKFFAKFFKGQNFHQLNFKNIPNLSIGLKNKAEIGIDRLVNASGAIEFYGAPLIIVDLGTATTFCIVDETHTYRGGLICPGINLTRAVLHEKTAKLPLVDISHKPRSLIGQNTVEAMQAGLFYGYQALLQGLIQKIYDKLQTKYLVVATGGYAELICEGMKEVDIIDCDLTLKSLNFIGNKLSSNPL